MSGGVEIIRDLRLSLGGCDVDNLFGGGFVASMPAILQGVFCYCTAMKPGTVCSLRCDSSVRHVRHTRGSASGCNKHPTALVISSRLHQSVGSFR